MQGVSRRLLDPSLDPRFIGAHDFFGIGQTVEMITINIVVKLA